MRFAAVLNREGGALKTTDLDAFASRVEEILTAEGHTVDIEMVSGGQLAAAIDAACSGPAEVILGFGSRRASDE
jgi:diacylglycerol kinase family enzyme